MTPMGYMPNITGTWNPSGCVASRGASRQAKGLFEGRHSFPSLHLRPHHIRELFGGTWNPNGIPSHSPGLRQRRYPGNDPDTPQTQPQRGCVILSATATPGKTAAAEKSSVICPDAHLGAIISSIGSATPLGLMMWHIPHSPG